MQSLVGLKIGILGGDARARYLAQELAESGASILAVAAPVSKAAPGIRVCGALDEVCAHADALIVPLPGIDEQGRLNDAHGAAIMEVSAALLDRVGKNTPIFTVVARGYMLRMAEQLGLRLVELSGINEFAIWNSIPSAEGAIQLAMEKAPITIHGSRSLVLGPGRTGVTLARMLAGIGSHTTVVARRPESVARAVEAGFRGVYFKDLAATIDRADFIFNTVPELVLSADILKKASPNVCIIDIASAPGGTDFKAAEELGLQAMLAPSLPGKAAPKTAGRIMARIITRLLLEDAPGSASKEQEVLANATQGR